MMKEVKLMKTSTVFVRVDPILKKDVEQVLSNLGLSTSTAITLFFRQVVLKHGLPFELTIPADINAELMTEEEMINEVCSGSNDCQNGKGKDPKKVFDELDKKYGL